MFDELYSAGPKKPLEPAQRRNVAPAKACGNQALAPIFAVRNRLDLAGPLP
jgi:hypothetical protein